MNIVLWVIIGVCAGWIASVVLHAGHSLLEDVMVGIIGALFGGVIMNSLGSVGVTGLNVYSLVVAVLGSLVMLIIGRLVHHV